METSPTPLPNSPSAPPPDKFKQHLSEIIQHINNHHQDIKTEEGAKTAFILPFINFVLEYDIFNPLLVMPEYCADERNAGDFD
jgi:hypothetical protein